MGFVSGACRAYYGDDSVTDALHARWMSAVGDRHDGYLAGIRFVTDPDQDKSVSKI